MSGAIWTKADVEYLLKNYGVKTLSQLQIALNRTKSAVQHKIYSHGLHDGVNYKWPERTRKTLVNLYKTHARKQLAKEFGVSEAAIKVMLYRYKIRKPR